MIVSTCRKLRCLSAFEKSNSSLTSFLRYCKDIANLLFWKLWWECARPSLSKIRVPICKKLKILKRNSRPVILGPFFPNLGKNEISWKKRIFQFLNIPIIYYRAKNQKKRTNHSREKCLTESRTDTHRQTGGKTDRKTDLRRTGVL